MSYRVKNIKLSFLSLMIALEVLLNPREGELRYRISRNVAVLLGKDKEDSEKIYSDARKLYVERSQIVHTGKARKATISDDDILKLRSYVRKSIKKFKKIRKSKKEILDLLNSSGFGSSESESLWK